MLLRLSYFFVVLFGLEIILSFLLLRTFINSLTTEYRASIEFSDSLIKDSVLHISRYTEILDINEKVSELDSYLSRVTASQKDSKFLEISEIYILSTDGSILYHLAEPQANYSLNLSEKLPILMKALRMRRGQVELTALEKESYERNTLLERELISNVPEAEETWIVASAPLYLSGKMVVSGGIHLIFHRVSPEIFIESRKDELLKGFYWVFGLGICGSFLFWLSFLYFNNRIVYERLAEDSYEYHLNKAPEKKSPTRKPSTEKSSKSMDAVFLD